MFTAAEPTGGPGGSDKSVDISWRMPAGRWSRRCHPAAKRLHGASPKQGTGYKSAQKHVREYFKDTERVNHSTIFMLSVDIEGIDIQPRSF